MIELLRESILPVNLPFTILLGAVALYWMVGLIGLVDLDGLDGGIDVGGGEGDGVDGIDGGSDEGGHTFASSFVNGLLNIVGASDAPLIFILSLFSAFLWSFNLVLNHYFNPGFSTGFATVLLIPVVILAFIVTRVLVIPLRPIMKMIRTDEKPVLIIGSSGVVRSASLDSEFGEVSVDASERALILRARISTEDKTLNKGDRILVVSKDSDSDTYLVRALD